MKNKDRVLRLPQVLELTGLSKPSVYRRMEDGRFPQNFRLGGPGSRAVGWLESDIHKWIDEQRFRRSANLK